MYIISYIAPHLVSICVHVCVCCCFSYVQIFATLWTIAARVCLWDSLVKNTGVGCYVLPQGIFPTQGLN